MSNFVENVTDYVLSGHAMLSVVTHEDDRAINDLATVAKNSNRELFVWTIASGWKKSSGEQAVPCNGMPDPMNAVQEIDKLPPKSMCVMKDFGVYLNQSTFPQADVVIGWLKEIRPLLYCHQRTIIFLGPDLYIPIQLKQEITQTDFGLPDTTQIEHQIKYVCDSVESKDGKGLAVDKSVMSDVVNACKGMTQQQTIDRASLAIRKNKGLTPESVKIILHEKAGVIRSSGILSYIEPPAGGLGIVGGLEVLKNHILMDKPCFTEEARAFGIEYPKGVLLVGIPGCGKTLISTAIASEFGSPLIQMDVGNIMDKYVGESESNMREAIKILESVAPCVLQLDEIEKGFGGAGDLDGGASKRVFGSFIKWLNDKTSPVYIVATANQVESLPPEFARKGRFDEIFGVDLPSVDERSEIVSIHLRKRNRNPDNFDVRRIAEATENFTGSDIEQAIKVGLKMAFANKSELTTDFCLLGVSSIVPLFKMEPHRIEKIREWCDARAKRANAIATPMTKSARRKITVSNGE